MIKRSLFSLTCMLGLLGANVPAMAQNDMSPVLYLESSASDNPDYRRMMIVTFLNGSTPTVTYKAYNRSEFIQVPSPTDPVFLAQCANGPATSYRDIQGFERAEARRKRNSQPVERVRFCIKNVPGWESQGNRKKYLDPIFNGMPYAASLNNGN